MFRAFPPILLLLFLLTSSKTDAQVKWIADAPFLQTSTASLYSLSTTRPLIIAVGNIHTQQSEKLLESQLLQKLQREHGAAQQGSSQDIGVAFINVRVFPDEPLMTQLYGIPVYHIDESDEILSKQGWNELYSISTTGLFLVTPDHLVYHLEKSTADEVYTAVQGLRSKLQPLNEPDIRLVDVSRDANASQVHVFVQNFSRMPVKEVEVIIRHAGNVIATSKLSGNIVPLGAAEVNVPVSGLSLNDIQVTATVHGDINPLNDSWTGNLPPAGQQSMAAVQLIK